MLIDCETCSVREIACSDCVVSVLLGAPHEDGRTLDPAERAAIGVLAGSGLVPPLQLVTESADATNPAKPSVEGATFDRSVRSVRAAASA